MRAGLLLVVCAVLGSAAALGGGKKHLRRFNATGDDDNYLKGIDVSSYQGSIDWNAVAGSGVSFAM